MRIRTRTLTPLRAFTGATLAALLLAACSDVGEPSRTPTPVIVPGASTAPPDADPTSSPPDVAPTTEQPPPPTATTTPPEDTGTTTAPSEAVRPVMPEVANERSLEGAQAYGRHYVETAGYLMYAPEPEGLASFDVAESCTLCNSWDEQNRLRVEQGTATEQPGYQVGAVTGRADDVGALIELEASQTELDLRDADGGVISTIPAAAGVLYMDLVWSSGQWQITELQFQADQ